MTETNNGRHCPLCGAESSRVYDHDREAKLDLVRRRRCLKCGARWATAEVFVRLIQDATDELGTGERYWVKGARSNEVRP